MICWLSNTLTLKFLGDIRVEVTIQEVRAAQPLCLRRGYRRVAYQSSQTLRPHTLPRTESSLSSAGLLWKPHFQCVTRRGKGWEALKHNAVGEVILQLRREIWTTDRRFVSCWHIRGNWRHGVQEIMHGEKGAWNRSPHGAATLEWGLQSRGKKTGRMLSLEPKRLKKKDQIVPWHCWCQAGSGLRHPHWLQPHVIGY